MSLKFIKDFEKSVDNIDGIGSSSSPPRYWYSTGNYVLNRIISGSFFKGIPQGRITNLAGPSTSGKSFLGANIAANAQKEGAFVFVVDSENALDDIFMSAVGVDVENNYMYKSATTIPQVIKLISNFLSKYKDTYGEAEDAPHVLIVIDSVDMLLTDNELDKFSKGEASTDMGAKNKQLKQMLRNFVQAIKHLNVSIITVSQVYKNQDLKSGEGSWLFADAVKYSASQIVLLTKLKLRDDATKTVSGIRMKCEGYKTRFTKPFQSVTIEVPYDTGMDKLSGFVDSLVNMGIIERKGAWYTIASTEIKFQSKNLEEHLPFLLEKAEERTDIQLKVTNLSDDDLETD